MADVPDDDSHALSLRCSRGTPPSDHRAFGRAVASDVKLSPPSTIIGTFPDGDHMPLA